MQVHRKKQSIINAVQYNGDVDDFEKQLSEFFSHILIQLCSRNKLHIHTKVEAIIIEVGDWVVIQEQRISRYASDQFEITFSRIQ